jgi:hypothetical protein
MKRLLKIGLLVSIASLSLLMGLDIPTYYQLDIKAMEMTLEGSKERLSCLRNDCSLSEQYAIDDRVQQSINDLYLSFETTPSKHIGYYTQNSVDARAYYDNNETLQEIYRTLQDKIEDVNSQIKTIMEEGK